MAVVYTVGTAFSGIGVPDLAARMLGMRTMWQVEKDDFCQKVLRKNFPEAALYGDIFDVHNLPYVDVFAAGFPCQPFSVAGRREGERDARYLVPEMLRVIDETKPRVCLLENVPGFASLDDGATFKRLLGALAEMGMDAEWGHLRASDFGAPHQRERWWLVGYADGRRCGQCDAGKRCIPFANEGRANMGDADSKHGNGRRSDTIQVSQFAASGLLNGQYGRTKSRLDRDSFRTAFGVHVFTPYPARRGQAQHAFEPPRTTTRKDLRAARLKALGNTMAFDVAFALMSAIKAWLHEQDEAVSA